MAKNVSTLTYLDAETHAMLTEAAQRETISTSAYVRRATIGLCGSTAMTASIRRSIRASGQARADGLAPA